MRSKHYVFVILLAAVSSSCVIGDDRGIGVDNNNETVDMPQPPPKPPHHKLYPPHPDPDGPTIPASPRDCISCHKAQPEPPPRIPSKCLRCHMDPHGGNYPPGPGPDFEPGDIPLDEKCQECHMVKPKPVEAEVFKLDLP